MKTLPMTNLYLWTQYAPRPRLRLWIFLWILVAPLQAVPDSSNPVGIAVLLSQKAVLLGQKAVLQRQNAVLLRQKAVLLGQ